MSLERKRTFTVQGDLRQGGKRASSIRVAIGDASEISTRTARATAKDYLAQISRGKHPKAEKRGTGGGEAATTEGEAAVSAGGTTLRQAWERYRYAHLVRKNRSERTIESYRDHVERIFIDWLDSPLQELGSDPAKVVTKHDDITKENGPYIANGSMRTLRAIYNHARKVNKSLPADNPVNAIDWNGEKRRDTGMGTSDLKGWFAELAALNNPVRREFHLFTLLSGSRPTALQEIKPSHINFGRRMMHIPKPKGAPRGPSIFPSLAKWSYASFERCVSVGRCTRRRLQNGYSPPTAHQGTSLSKRRTEPRCRSGATIFVRASEQFATAAGVSEFDAKLLMNHAIPGVNAGYITRHKLLEDHLRRQQQAISSAAFAALGNFLTEHSGIRDWLGRGGSKRLALVASVDQYDGHRLIVEPTDHEAA